MSIARRSVTTSLQIAALLASSVISAADGNQAKRSPAEPEGVVEAAMADDEPLTDEEPLPGNEPPADQGSLTDDELPADQGSPADEGPSADEEPTVDDERLTDDEQLMDDEPRQASVASPPEAEGVDEEPTEQVARLEPAPSPPAVVAMETSESLSRRVQQARRAAAEQQKGRVSTEAHPDGLSREELEMRGAERNIFYYDKQIYDGQGTQAIEAFRKLALETLANARRRHLMKVFADTIHHPDAPALLRAHAQRGAELQRVRFLAQVKGFSPLVKRADDLMTQADAGLKESMQRLRSESLAQGKLAGSNVAVQPGVEQ